MLTCSQKLMSGIGAAVPEVDALGRPNPSAGGVSIRSPTRALTVSHEAILGKVTAILAGLRAILAGLTAILA